MSLRATGDCLIFVMLLLLASCSLGQERAEISAVQPKSAAGEHSEPFVPEMVFIQAGSFTKGSSQPERELAYQLDEAAYWHRLTREQKWYDSELDRQVAYTGSYHISKTAITNEQYAYFIQATNHPAPAVSKETWQSYELVHPYQRTMRFQWADRRPPVGREQHPVVLVSYADATAYAVWLSRKTGQNWRLPGLDEWERAARGDDGRAFPWGDAFDENRLNSHDAGPFDTEVAGSYPNGASPHGVLDMAGQVFEWIGGEPEHSRAWVKGGSWDDSGCGVCRPAARHSRPKALKHILIGFRVVRIN